MAAFYRFIRICFKIIGVPLMNIRIKGKENIPENSSYIICSNHTSATDVVPIIIAFKKQVYFMGKEELFRNKILAFLFNKMGVFPVSRGKADRTALKTAISVLTDGKILGIFPEGTRNPDGPPREAKQGISLIAAKAKSGILPVCIYRKGKFALFKKTVIRIGEYLPYDKLNLSLDKQSMENLSTLITEKITDLWELKY